MLADYRVDQVPDEPFDVCIVGAGAAGLALASSLDGSGLKVVVLEAGGARPTAAGVELYKGEVLAPGVHAFPHFYRVRALGGSSRIWGGRCLPFDDIDFETRPWVPHSGWPFGAQELAPFYRRAQEAAEAGPFDYDISTALPTLQAQFVDGIDTERLHTTIERFSRPTNFWTRYGRELTASRDVTVWSNASVTSIELEDEGRSVRAVRVAQPEGSQSEIRAGRYVLALGGLETTRLLLASTSVRPAGIGNDDDNLGRYYMSHIAATHGEIRFSGPTTGVAHDYDRDAEGIYVRRRLWPTPAAQAERRLLNVAFRTHLPDIARPEHRDAVLSAMYLVKNMILYEYSRTSRESRTSLASLAGHITNIISQPAQLFSFSQNWVRRRTLATRKLPSVVRASRSNSFALEFHGEQTPNPSSRLTLGSEVDAFSMPRLRIGWTLCEQDLSSIDGAYRLLSEELARTGRGRLRWDARELRLATETRGAYGGHHLGSTRMSRDPRHGVVDTDLRVHGVNNLFVASGSVFPTSGQANPTLTILALTFRLADHLTALSTG